MTLSTVVYIQDEIDPKEVFLFCQGLLSEFDGMIPRRTVEQQKWVEFPEGEWKFEAEVALEDKTYPGREYIGAKGDKRVWVIKDKHEWSRDNELGQDLPAWLMTHYRDDGFARPDGDACHPYCDKPESGGDYHFHEPAHFMKVDFDTSYGYCDKRGWRCGDLHSVLVFKLGTWLDGKGVRWQWRNEYSGEIYTGFDGLNTLISDTVGAMDWFDNQVVPAMRVLAQEKGATLEP